MNLTSVAMIGAFLTFVSCGGVAADNDDLAGLKSRLHELRTASGAAVMLIPYHTYFLIPVNKRTLEVASCRYKVPAGPRLDELRALLGDSIIAYSVDPRAQADLRIGITFQTGNDGLQELYFDDWGGLREVSGVSGNHKLAAKADLPNQLRALVLRKGVVLSRDYQSRCPHA